VEKPPLDASYRRLVAAVILRAVRDLHEKPHRCEAAHWLADEGPAFGEMIGIDVDVTRVCRETKGREGYGRTDQR
jgi:hypothetical protein